MATMIIHVCVKHLFNIPDIFLILALRIILKNRLDLKGGYVAMTTMIICVKHLFNNPDIFSKFLLYKNHFKKWA